MRSHVTGHEREMWDIRICGVVEWIIRLSAMLGSYEKNATIRVLFRA